MRDTNHTRETDGSSQQPRRTASRRSFLKATAGASTLAAGIGSGAIGSAVADIPTPWLHRDGNQILDPSDNEVVLRGVNIPDAKRMNTKTFRPNADETIARVTNADDGWHPRVIRLPVQPLDIGGHSAGGIPPVPAFDQGQLESYVENYLRPAVDLCAKHNVYCIVDYHRHRGQGDEHNYTSQAIHDELTMFWETVAPRFAEDSHVLFEVYNEPIAPFQGHYDPMVSVDPTDDVAIETWNTWKEAAQPWVDTIRENAPQNLILIGSPRWSQWTYQAPNNEFEGDNLAYTGHVYAHPNIRPLGTYFGEPSTEVPVFMTEFGWGPYGADWLKGTAEKEGEEFRSFFEEYDSVHWQVWCFDSKWSPAMLDHNWELNTYGQFWKDYLQEKKGEDEPGDDGSTETPTTPPTTEPDSNQAPTPPSNLSVVSTTHSRVELSWDAATDPGGAALDHYVVAVDGSKAATVSADVTTATVDGLAADTEYDVMLTAVDAAGEASDPAVTTARTGTEPASGPTVSVDVSRVQSEADVAARAAITLSEAPSGLAGYTLSVGVADTSVVTIAGASYPDAMGLTEPPEITDDGSSVRLKAVDVQDEITAGDETVELATVDLAAAGEGETAVGVVVEAMDDDGGALIEPRTTAGTFRTASLPAIEGAVPGDVDGDGLHEDFNGNGRLDSDDVVIYFKHKDDAAIIDHTGAYDFNGNGRIDFDDVATLFESL